MGASDRPRTSKAPGQGETSALERKFQSLGLHGPDDFVLHLPLRYEDNTHVHTISGLRPGVHMQVEGEITRCDVQFRPRRQLIADIVDDTGTLTLRWLNFYGSQQRQMTPGKRVRVRGELRIGPMGREMVHPLVVNADTPLPDTLTPIYPTTAGLPQPSLRRAIAQALDRADLSDSLPEAVRESLHLIDFEQAVRFLHQPPPDADVSEESLHQQPAWYRIKFDELLAQQLSLAEARALRRQRQAMPLPAAPAKDKKGLVARLRASLPFALTGAQQRVLDEIAQDLAQGHPMHRLLQGDVGSGKTVVAALAAAQAIAAGAQVAMMAPTEILAEQHFRKLLGWLEPLGIKTAWLAGRVKARERREVLAGIADGSIPMVVGTQALIQEGVEFAQLGLIIVDEQHRFGVGQRMALGRRNQDPTQAWVAHQLTMSATPIPRTLAMTFFGDLDVSVIDELPPGRTPVITKLFDAVRREEVIEHVADEIARGHQAYWVCPLVEESEALELQTAVDTYEALSAALAPRRVGLVHGRLTAPEKQAVMEAFRAGEIDLLVATTVIEVGVDVPNASIMVIEHAERFGLAQLHQLRGRVGRGSAESVCVLLFQRPLSQVARQRLRAMFETTDGFEIARRDLQQRGPGEFLGTRQSGMALLRFADPERDEALVELARNTASQLRKQYPQFQRRHLKRWLRGKEDFLYS